MTALTRAGLTEAVHREVGLSRRDSARFVEAVFETVAARLAAGEVVKLSGFGTFATGRKRPRIGRNPKTGEPAPVVARRVAVFRPSRLLTAGMNRRMPGEGS